MAHRLLRIYGDPVLREKSSPIEAITEEVKQLAREMIEFGDDNNGIGLSAIQFGIPIRLFVLRNYIIMPDGTWTASSPQVFINPKIRSVSKETEIDDEGCMSIPGIRVEVERPVKIKIEATDLSGETFVEEIEGLNARVRLHENDHLNGVLTVDRTSPKEKKRVETQLRALKKRSKS
ncbi:MAG: Peptide deformylase [Chlamydiae bacterium]|nr:Peptide deformylase [Chlamydiota bacterium]